MIERKKKRSYLDKSVLSDTYIRKQKELPKAPDIDVKQEEVETKDVDADKMMDEVKTDSEVATKEEFSQQDSHGNQDFEFKEGRSFASYREFQRALKEYEQDSNFRFSANGASYEIDKEETGSQIATSNELNKLLSSMSSMSNISSISSDTVLKAKRQLEMLKSASRDAPKKEVRLVCDRGYEERNLTSSGDPCPVFILLWVKQGLGGNWKRKEYIINHFNKTEHNHPPIERGAKLSEMNDDSNDVDCVSSESMASDKDWKPSEDDDTSSDADLSPKPDTAIKTRPVERWTVDDVLLHEEGPVNVNQDQTLCQGQNFANYREFQETLMEYEEKSDFKFTIRSTCKNKLEDAERGFPKNQVKVICHMGRKAHNPKESKDYCPVTLFLQLRRPKDARSGKTPWYTITRFNKSEHNHPPMSRSQRHRMEREDLEDDDGLKAERQLWMSRSADQVVDNNDEESSDHEEQCAPLNVLKNHLPEGLKQLPNDSEVVVKAKRQLHVLEGQYRLKGKQDIVPCNICGQNFPTVHKTILHICKKYFNMARVWTCSDCGKDFTYDKGDRALDYHRNRIHLKQEPYICSVKGCDHKYASIEGMRGHMGTREQRSSGLRKVKHPKTHWSLATEERKKMMSEHYQLFRYSV